MSLTATTRAAILSTLLAATLPPSATAAQTTSPYPEIVRLSLVQGDVRITRGPRAEKASGSAWEQAVPNLPLQSGFSIATGEGRAEIEFEDASTLYLAPNSALTLNDLTTFNSIPSSTFTLLTGTVTLDLHTTIPGEHFLLETPVGQVVIDYPANAIERADSYLDAMAVTTWKLPAPDPQDLSFPNHAVASTVVYRKGVRPRILPAHATENTTTAWDHWVAARISGRNAAMLRVMHQANLTTPLPGLNDMEAQGSFFSCEPYGTCWQPSTPSPEVPPSTAQQASPEQATAQQTASPNAAASATSTPRIATTTPNATWEDVGDFPCFPGDLRQLVAIDPLTGRRRILRTEFDPSAFPYDWTVCHAGAWIRFHHRYAWVVGRHRHHTYPVHWVKSHGRTAFVPVHPLDAKGKPPVNLREGLFTLDHSHHTAQLLAWKPDSPLDVLPQPPKSIREPELPLLARAEAPRLQARIAEQLPGSSINPHTLHTTSTLSFNSHSQTFMLARQSTLDGHTRSTVEPFGGPIDHPNYASNSFRESIAAQRSFEASASRSSGAFAASSYHTSSASSFSGGSFHGSSSGGSSSGGSFSGGGSRGGSSGGGGSFSGASASSGGSSHGGGGGGGSFSSAAGSSSSSSASSSGSSSSASSGASGGGSHH
jgi:hypothetical protein